MPTYFHIYDSRQQGNGKPCGTYELRHADYEYSRSVNRRGDAVSDVTGGTIRVVMAGLGDEELFRWLFDSSRQMNGEISTNDNQEKVMEKIHFKNGRAVKYRLHFDANTREGVSAILLIDAAEIATDNGAVF